MSVLVLCVGISTERGATVPYSHRQLNGELGKFGKKTRLKMAGSARVLINAIELGVMRTIEQDDLETHSLSVAVPLDLINCDAFLEICWQEVVEWAAKMGMSQGIYAVSIVGEFAGSEEGYHGGALKIGHKSFAWRCTADPRVSERFLPLPN